MLMEKYCDYDHHHQDEEDDEMMLMIVVVRETRTLRNQLLSHMILIYSGQWKAESGDKT